MSWRVTGTPDFSNDGPFGPGISYNWFYDGKNFAFTQKENKNYDGFQEADSYLISYDGIESRVVIHEGVTVIGNTAFAKNHQIRSIHLPESLRVIEAEAFRECVNLEYINFPADLEIVGEGAFKGCTHMKEDVILPNIRKLGKYAFMGCSGIEDVQISGPLQEIGEGVFWGCENLWSVSLPECLRELPARMCEGCENLFHVTVSATTTHVGDYCFSGCVNLPCLEVPEDTTFGVGVFKACDNMVDMYGMVVQNGYFLYCSWLADSVTIPDTVTILDAEAFFQCIGHCDLEIPDSVRQINGYSREMYTGFYTLKVGDLVSRYPYLFSGNEFGEIVLSEQTTGIAAGVFSANDIEEIIIPAGVKFIGSEAFEFCTKLRKVVFRGDAPEIGEDAFGEVESVMYYPKENPTWTEQVFGNYGGNLTWTAYEEDTVDM